MNCPKCGTRLVGGANFCHQCGECVAELGSEDFAGSEATVAAGLPGEAQDELEFGAQGLPLLSAGSRSPALSHRPEEHIWEGRLSAKAMAASFVATALASAVGLAGSVTAFVHSHNWLGVILLLTIPILWLAQVMRVAKRCLSEHYRLTERTLFLQIGLLRCQKHQIDLTQVETVRIHQNMLDRLLDVGSIEILTRDRHIGRLVLEGIEDADAVAEKIRSLGRLARDKQVALVERVGGGG